MKTEFHEHISCDVLVTGGGLAAIKTSYECLKAGLTVVMVVKRGLCSGSSFYPLTSGLGCQAPKDEADKPLFYEELMESGAGMAGERLTQIYIDEIHDRVKELPEMGFAYGAPEGRKACFAKRERALFVWSGWDAISEKVGRLLRGFPGFRLLEYADVVQLLKKDGQITGAVAADYADRLYYITAPSVVLETGGYSGLYKHSLNTDDVIGLGQAMALEAGAQCVNLEFTQFIPGMISPVYKMLFSETSLKFCEAIEDADGNDILSKYLPEGITVRQCLDSRGGHGPFTNVDESRWFDIAMMSEILKGGGENGFRLIYSPRIYEDKNPFNTIYLSFVTRNNVNLVRDKIMIAPFGHAANGGILIDENASAGLPGLYAAGESTGGLHGADRHGGLASGSCLVFGHRAAQDVIRRHRAGEKAPEVSAREAMDAFTGSLDTGHAGNISPGEVMVRIKELLWKRCNVVREESSLKLALSELDAMEGAFNARKSITAAGPVREAVAARHSLRMARALFTAALGRRDSRGAHFRSDYPERDDVNFGKRQFISLRDGAFVSEFR